MIQNPRKNPDPLQNIIDFTLHIGILPCENIIKIPKSILLKATLEP